METNRPMLMLYLGLLTPLLALPALMFLARLERWTAPEAATGAATGSVWAAVPGSASSGGRPSPALLHRGGQRASAGCDACEAP